MIAYEQHPLSAAFPAMPEPEIAALSSDIAAHGQRVPGVLYQGMVLDGWHRYRACQLAGVEFLVRDYNEAEEGDPRAFVDAVNACRRHLTSSQIAASKVLVWQWIPLGANQHQTGGSEPGSYPPKSESELAREAGVSDRTIRHVKTAIRGGLGEQVRDGELSAKKAAEIARGPVKPTPPVTPARTKPRAIAQPEEMPESFQIAEAKDTIRDLAAENESLRDALAVEAMDASEEQKLEAANTIAALRERIRVLEAELDAVRATRDQLMTTNGEMKRTLVAMQRQLKAAA